MIAPRYQSYPKQRGFALIAALLMLVVLTLLGVSMMSGVGLQDKMSGNVREKTRATTAASFLVNAVDNLLPTMPLSVSGCTSQATGWRVCAANTLTNSAAVDDATWGLTGSVTYAVSATMLPPSQAFPSALINSGGGNNVYAHAPKFFIEYQGRAPTPPGYSASVSQYGVSSAPVLDVYRTTAMATGGNDAAVSVIQSNYNYMHTR